MNDLPRQKLKEILTRYGHGLAEDPRRCEAFLKDFCPQHKREVFLLACVARQSIPAELLKSSGSLSRNMLVGHHAKRLHEDCGLTLASARWAVESWALALGIAEGVPQTNGATYELAAPTPVLQPHVRVPATTREESPKTPVAVADSDEEDVADLESETIDPYEGLQKLVEVVACISGVTCLIGLAFPILFAFTAPISVVFTGWAFVLCFGLQWGRRRPLRSLVASQKALTIAKRELSGLRAARAKLRSEIDKQYYDLPKNERRRIERERRAIESEIHSLKREHGDRIVQLSKVVDGLTAEVERLTREVAAATIALSQVKPPSVNLYVLGVLGFWLPALVGLLLWAQCP